MPLLLKSAEIEQLRTYIVCGDAVGYYEQLATYEYDYGRLAAGLVDNTSLNGQIARKFAESVARVEQKSLTESGWGTIIQELMKADFDAREDVFTDNGGSARQGVDVTLSVEAIEQYHTVVYHDFGNELPIDAWTPYVPLKYAADKDAKWAEILNSSDSLFSQAWNGTLRVRSCMLNLRSLTPSAPPPSG